MYAKRTRITVDADEGLAEWLSDKARWDGLSRSQLIARHLEAWRRSESSSSPVLAVAAEVGLALRDMGEESFRIGNTRVTLESVFGLLREGADANEIAETFPALPEDLIHLAIAVYIRLGEAAVTDYLAACETAFKAAAAQHETKAAQELKQRLRHRQDHNE